MHDSDHDHDAGHDSTDRVPLFETLMLTNNATHIQQTVLALTGAGYDVTTTWTREGCWLTVYLTPRVEEQAATTATVHEADLYDPGRGDDRRPRHGGRRGGEAD